MVVTLKIDGCAVRDVAAVTYSFNRTTDIEGLPTSIPRGGKIVIRVKAMNDGNPELLGWMTQGITKKGSIEFMDSRDVCKLTKSVDFENAYCIDFVEHWEDVPYNQNNITLAHWEEITISCQKIVNGLITYENLTNLRFLDNYGTQGNIKN